MPGRRSARAKVAVNYAEDGDALPAVVKEEEEEEEEDEEDGLKAKTGGKKRKAAAAEKAAKSKSDPKRKRGKGRYLYDVCTKGGRGTLKSRHSNKA